jgi:tetratricopeptide (TPR) repeat protein
MKLLRLQFFATLALASVITAYGADMSPEGLEKTRLQELGDWVEPALIGLRSAIDKNEKSWALQIYETSMKRIHSSNLPNHVKLTIEQKFLSRSLNSCAGEMSAYDGELMKRVVADLVALSKKEGNIHTLSELSRLFEIQASREHAADLQDSACAVAQVYQAFEKAPEVVGPAVLIAARVCHAAGKYEAAIERYRTVLKLGYVSDLGDEGDKDTRGVRLELANCLLQENKPEQSLGLLKELLKDKPFKDSVHNAMIRSLAGHCYLAQKKYSEATTDLKDSLEMFDLPGATTFAEYQSPMWPFGKEIPTKESTLKSLQIAYTAAGQSASAYKAADQLKQIQHEKNQSELLDKFYRERADLCKPFLGSDRAAARKAAEQMDSNARGAFADAPLDLSAELNIIGARCYAAALYPEAASYFERAKTILEEQHLSDTSDYGRILSNLGRLEIAIANYPSAQAHIESAMKLRAHDFNGFAISKGWLGRLYMLEGDTQKSRTVLEEVIDFRERHEKIGPTFVESADNLVDLATACNSLGLAESAQKCAERAISIRSGMKNQTHTVYENGPGKPLSIVALSLAIQGKDAQAQSTIDQLLKDVVNYPSPHPDLSDIYENTADAFLKLSDSVRARNYYQKALDMRVSLFGAEHPTVKEVRAKLTKLPAP